MIERNGPLISSLAVALFLLGIQVVIGSLSIWIAAGVVWTVAAVLALSLLWSKSHSRAYLGLELTPEQQAEWARLRRMRASIRREAWYNRAYFGLLWFYLTVTAIRLLLAELGVTDEPAGDFAWVLVFYGIPAVIVTPFYLRSEWRNRQR